MPFLILFLAVAFALSPLLVPDFGGFDPDRFPVPQDNPPVQPAGYAFAIWGVIYLWLVGSALFGVAARRDARDWGAVRAPLAISLAIGAVWLPAAQLSPVLATVLIWFMLVTALLALWRSPVRDPGWASWPLGLYAGWLSAASCVAIGLLLAGYGVMGETGAAVLMLTIAIVLAVFMQNRLDRAPTYGLAVIWALTAVAVQNGFDFGLITNIAIAGSLAVAWPTVRAATGI
jgi:hypothetical protein